MPNNIKYTHCPCCSSAAISKVFTCTDFTVTHEQFEVWACGNCTFRFTQNAPPITDIGRYYQSEEYVSHSDTKQGLVNRLYHIVRNHTLTTKARLVSRVTGLKQGRLLDVGAGTGAFAGTMKKAGWEVTALEPDDQARKVALANGVKLQPLNDLENLATDSFNAITLWHVLEHVHQFHEYLQRFSMLLKADGRLLIAVPNYTSYDATRYKQFWAAYDVPRHLSHFSPRSMLLLLQQIGFVVEAVKPMWFDSFYVSLLSERYRHGHFFLRPVFIGLVSNIKAFFSRRRCSSLIYIVRKGEAGK